ATRPERNPWNIELEFIFTPAGQRKVAGEPESASTPRITRLLPPPLAGRNPSCALIQGFRPLAADCTRGSSPAPGRGGNNCLMQRQHFRIMARTLLSDDVHLLG